MTLQLQRQTVVLDTDDLDAESAFWSTVLGGTVDRDDDWHALRTPAGFDMAFQLAPDHVRPDWPDGQPQQIHLDLIVPDIESAERDVLAAGATLLKSDTGSDFRVYADPSGHPFCLCWE